MNLNIPRQLDAWEKWNWLWKAIFYTTILLSFGLLFFDEKQGQRIWVAGLLTGTLLLWHWVGLRWAYKNLTTWNDQPIARFIVIIGDIILWFALINISPVYYIALFGLFIAVFRNLPIRYAGIAALLLSVATIYEQISDLKGPIALRDPMIWLFFAMVFVSVVLGVWVSAIIEQSTRRRELIDQLESTQLELAAAERREGILEERQRLAREIHDTLAQGFTSIVMHLEAAEQSLPDDLGRLHNHLVRARSTARDSLDQARRVVQDLRPEVLEGRSLTDAITRTTERWEEETGIPVTIQTTGRRTILPPNIEVTLLRAVQEALNNIRKHAKASDVQLTLSYMGDLIILDLQDDGVGINQAEPTPLAFGYGLQAMRERAEDCGGSLVIESDPGEGTTIVLTIPLESRHSDG